MVWHCFSGVNFSEGESFNVSAYQDMLDSAMLPTLMEQFGDFFLSFALLIDILNTAVRIPLLCITDSRLFHQQQQMACDRHLCMFTLRLRTEL